MLPRRPEAAATAALAATLLAGGCVTTSTTESRRFDPDSLPERSASLVSPEVLAGLSARIGREATVEDLGWLPADVSTMPVVSPAGDAVAVQRRPAPSIDARLGRSAGLESPPPAVAIHRLIEAADGTPPRFDEGRVPPEPLILAKGSGGTAGPLVGAPRSDGHRWIGRIAWSDGARSWLVAEEALDAMPAASADGWLAWCRHEADGGNVLCLSDPRGMRREWPAEEGHEWILPAFSGDGRHFMALLQGDGRAELVAWDRDDLDGAAIVQPLSVRVDAERSLAAIELATVPPGAAAGPGWWLVHPDLRRLVCWLPEAARFDPLPPGSFAWAGPVAGGIVLADTEGLWFADAEATGEFRLLLDGPWLPHPIPGEAGSPSGSLLLFGGEGGGYRVLRLRLGEAMAVPLEAEAVPRGD